MIIWLSLTSMLVQHFEHVMWLDFLEFNAMHAMKSPQRLHIYLIHANANAHECNGWNISLQRDAEAIRTALYLGVALAITWIIGAVGLSLAWLILVLALAATIVKARVSRLLQTELQHELARLRRRRALYKDETAEWLSLLLNKWQVLFSAVIDD